MVAGLVASQPNWKPDCTVVWYLAMAVIWVCATWLVISTDYTSYRFSTSCLYCSLIAMMLLILTLFQILVHYSFYDLWQREQWWHDWLSFSQVVYQTDSPIYDNGRRLSLRRLIRSAVSALHCLYCSLAAIAASDSPKDFSLQKYFGRDSFDFGHSYTAA